MLLVINLFAIISLLSLSVILLLRKNNSVTNILLALIIFNPAINFINNVFIELGLIHRFPEIVFFSFMTGSLYAPLVLAYCHKMIGKKVKLVTWLHGVTFAYLLMTIVWYIQFLTFSPDQKHQYLLGLKESVYPWQLELSNTLFSIIQLIYIVIALIRVLKFKKSSQQFFANTEKIKMDYTLSFTILTSSLTFILFVCYLSLPPHLVEYIIIPIICIIIYIFVLYNAFHNSVIFQQQEYDDFAECLVPMKRYDEYSEPLCQEIKAIEANPGKYKLAEAEMELYLKKLNIYFEKEKPYLASDISLQSISEAIGACSHHVSMTINIKYGMNFFNLINSYRIKEAQILLAKKNEMGATIEQIGYDVGFQTKSTFYNAFKTHAGTTPTNYVKSLLN